MNPLVLTAIMAGGALVAIFAGFPITWSMGGVAAMAALFLWGPNAIEIMALGVWNEWTNPILMALPLFVFLSSLLQYSGIGDDLFEMIYSWVGGLRGGLAMGIIAIGATFAAMSTSVSAACAMMTLLALPAMFKRKYEKSLAVGTIVAGASLGPTIPPSIDLIIYGSIAKQSIGKLWFAALVPGLTLALFYIIYIACRSLIDPKIAPPIPVEERASWGKKFRLLRAVIAPVGIIVLILVGIYTGIITPTEASAVGALAMFCVVALRRRLTLNTLLNSLWTSLKVTAMIFWLLIGVNAFNSVYVGLGARTMIQNMVIGLEVSPFMVVVVMMVIILFLGTVMDDWAIMMVSAPIFIPIVEALGFSTLWFGIIFLFNILLGCSTPPYGYNLFIMKGLAPKGVTMGDIYRSILPFCGVQVFTIALCMIVPSLVTWLPNMVFAK